MTERPHPDQTVDRVSVLEALAASLPTVPRVSLREAPVEAITPVNLPGSSEMPAGPGKPEWSSRYQLVGEIARGGMGAVLKGRDTDLGRDVAVKVLLEKHQGKAELLQRFVEEAQIGGQLQHPGIVPVYELGQFPDLRPYFAMKLVKGRTLAALLAERREAAEDRPRFLGIFEQVCQTLAYAHARGVIHRDLKPSNIMVGSFGEVQVMDWGLAKVLAEGGAADERRARQEQQDGGAVRTVRTEGSGSESQAGSVLGTPAYMPPEQARGEVERLDERCDVFGLGAILCEVLTGKPPYAGKDTGQVHRMASSGDLAGARARLDTCGADPELVGLAKGCLTPEPGGRPRNAGVVAHEITAYLHSVEARLRQAELAGAEARARAEEERKRRRLTVALAATILLALTLGGGGWLWVKQEREARQARRSEEVNDALNRVTALKEQVKSAGSRGANLWAQAREQAQRAAALADSGPTDPALATRVRRLLDELEEEEKDRRLLADLDEAWLAQAETDDRELRYALERAVPLFRKALRDFGLPAGVGEPQAVATRIQERPRPVRDALLTALDGWISLTEHPRIRLNEPHLAWLRQVLARADADPWRKAVREASAAKDAKQRRAALVNLAGDAAAERQLPRTLATLALRLNQLGAVRPAVAMLRRAWQRHPGDFWVNRTLGTSLAKMRPPRRDEATRYLTAAVVLRPDSAVAHTTLGYWLSRQGKRDEALAAYRKADLLKPEDAAILTNLGAALFKQGKPEEATRMLRKAIALQAGNAMAHMNLGVALAARGQTREAIAAYHQAIALRPNDAGAYINLGLAFEKRGKPKEALAAFHKAVAIEPEYAKAHEALGTALYDRNQFTEAATAYRQAIALDPDLVEAHYNLGNTLRKQGDRDGASAAYRKALALRPDYLGAYINLGTVLTNQGNLDEAGDILRKAVALGPEDPLARYNLGRVLYQQGNLDGAVAAWRKTVALRRDLVEAQQNLGIALGRQRKFSEAVVFFQNAANLRPNVAPVHRNLGFVQAQWGKPAEAAVSFHKTIELNRNDAVAHFGLGQALANLNRLGEATRAFRRGTELAPKDATMHANLGFILARQRKFAEAAVAFRKAIALRPNYPFAHTNLGAVLGELGQLDESVAESRTAILLRPEYALAHCNLGLALERTGKFAEALFALEWGHALGTRNPRWRSPSARWVKDAARLARLEGRLPAILKVKDAPADAAERIEFARMCRLKKLPLASARLYTDAFAAQPKLAEDLMAGHRYDAARSAALAGCRQGEDATKLDDKEYARWRQQALAWLRDDFALWVKVESGGPADRAAVQQWLGRWQHDPDLAGIRDGAAVGRLPAEEQKTCKMLWEKVARLLERAGMKK